MVSSFDNIFHFSTILPCKLFQKILYNGPLRKEEPTTDREFVELIKETEFQYLELDNDTNLKNFIEI